MKLLSHFSFHLFFNWGISFDLWVFILLFFWSFNCSRSSLFRTRVVSNFLELLLAEGFLFFDELMEIVSCRRLSVIHSLFSDSTFSKLRSVNNSRYIPRTLLISKLSSLNGSLVFNNSIHHGWSLVYFHFFDRSRVSLLHDCVLRYRPVAKALFLRTSDVSLRFENSIFSGWRHKTWGFGTSSKCVWVHTRLLLSNHRLYGIAHIHSCLLK